MGWVVEPVGEYPPDWKTIAEEAKARAGWRCEHCGMAFPTGSNLAIEARNKNGRPTILTVHHLDGDKANCDWRNLLACCQRCHLKIQATWGPGRMLPDRWRAAPGWITARGLAYQDSAQLELL